MMKSRNAVVITSAVMFLMMFFGYEIGSARDRSITPARIGIVSVRRVFENNKKNANWQQKMEKERASMMEQMQQKAKEIDAAKADMATRKEGSSDYMRLMRQVMEETAKLEIGRASCRERVCHRV